MSGQKKRKTVVAVQADLMGRLLDRLEKQVETAQKALDAAMLADEIGLVTFAKVAKTVSETLSMIHKVRYGKAAQEEILNMISDLQSHMKRALNTASETRRRDRQVPLIEVVGKLYDQSEITASIEEDEEDTTARARALAEELESDMRGDLETAINDTLGD